MSKKSPHSGLYDLLFFIFILGSILVGYATLNIINFAIEDSYDIPMSSSFSIWGRSYATSISWILVTGIVLLPIVYFHKRLSENNKDLYQSSFRSMILSTSIFIGLTIAFFYILAVVYSYFSGKSEPEGLLRIFSTLTTLFLGVLYMYIEKKFTLKLGQKPYWAFFLGFLGLFTVTALVLTLKYSSPEKMRDIQKDVKTISSMDSLARDVYVYFNRRNALPQTKQDLIGRITHTPQEELKVKYKDIEYAYVDSNKFKVCAQFSTRVEDGRRMVSSPKFYYKPGHHCATFSIEKQKSKTIFKPLLNQTIKINFTG